MKNKKLARLILGIVYLILAVLIIKLGYSDGKLFMLSTLVILLDSFINITESKNK